MDTITVRLVKTKVEIQNFINLPFKLYKNDTTWVPPIKEAVKELIDESKGHPFLKNATCKVYIAYKKDEVVGRIFVCENHRFNNFHNTKEVHFGFFDSINDQKVADALFDQVKKFAKSQGCEKIAGPYNPSTNYEAGQIVDGDKDPPQLMMTYSPIYHANLIERSGLKKEKDLLAWKLNFPFDMPEKISYIARNVAKKRKVTFRTFNKKKFKEERKLMHEIYNKAWEKNWGFVPMTKDEFYKTVDEMKIILDTRLVQFVEVDKKIAGFIVTLPDINQLLIKNRNGSLVKAIYSLLFQKKKITRARTITMGIVPEFRNMGLETLFYAKTKEIVETCGYKEVEMSWVLDDNLKMNKPIKLLGGECYKTYRIYSASIN